MYYKYAITDYNFHINQKLPKKNQQPTTLPQSALQLDRTCTEVLSFGYEIQGVN